MAKNVNEKNTVLKGLYGRKKGNDGNAKGSKAEGGGHAVANDKYLIEPAKQKQDAQLGELGPSRARHEKNPTQLDKGVKQGKMEDDKYGIMSCITGRYEVDVGDPELDPKDFLKTQKQEQEKGEVADRKNHSAGKISKSKPQKKY